MKYRFAFDRKRFMVLMLGTILVVVLAFVCGVVTGVGLWMPTQSELALLKKGTPGTEVASTVKLPAKPELPKPELPKAAAVVPEKPAPTPAATTAANPPAPQAPVTAAAPPEPAALSPLQAAAQATSTADDLFALQLGSFLKPENAKQLQAELKDKGYAATIFRSTDADQRTWHTVRISGFKTLVAASQAAADFSAKERIQALVRRSDSL
jgi:cell division septation protein DedD